MAKLSREDVLKLAKLSRLQLSDDEVVQFIQEINSILGYVEILQNQDLDKVEPTYQVTGLENVMREDKVIDYGASTDELLKNAPASHDGHIKVKRMLT